MYCGILSKSMEENKKTRKKSKSDLDYSDLEEKIEAKDTTLEKLNMDYSKLEEENNKLKKEIKRVEKEKDEALSRLSKIAGQKLMKGNPAIADLGNPNRPAKLAERWASLYTDEWSDAYEEITENNNNDLVPEKQLMDIVVWCYEKCKELEEAHRKTLEEKLLNAAKYVHVIENELDIGGSDEECSNDENADISQTIDALVENAISQRQCSSTLIKSVKKKCLKDYNERNHSPSSAESDFVQKCVELCWLMCIADPPMVIEFQNFEAKPIDMVKFNKYDTTGTTVEFVVWPVLLLHNDGPVLSKGTVQTYFSEQDQTNKNNPGGRQQPVISPFDTNSSHIIGTPFDETKHSPNKRGISVKGKSLKPGTFKSKSLDSLYTTEPEHLGISDGKNEQTKQNISAEDSNTETETSTNTSENIPETQTKIDDQNQSEESKRVDEFKKSIDNFVQKSQDNHTRRTETKTLVKQSSTVKEDNTEEVLNNHPLVIDQEVATGEIDSKYGQCQNLNTNSSSGNKVTGKTKNTKYYVKSDKVCSGKAHTDTLHRNFGKLLEKSKLPRQFSVDKHQPY